MRRMVACGRLGMVAGLALLASALSASAQDIVIEAPASAQDAPPENALTEEELDALREALNFDTFGATTRAAGRPAPPAAPSAAWNRNDNRDGSAAMSVKRALPTGWDTSIGADFGLAAAPATTYAPGQPWAIPADQNTGAAWANLKLPNVASFDARLGANAPSRIGATLGRTQPIGGGNSITLENSYAVTETLASLPAATPPASAPASGSDRVWSARRAVRFDIGATGTTLGVSAFHSSADNVTRNRLSAEQKLTSALSLTAAVTDPGAADANKSIGAAFKWKW